MFTPYFPPEEVVTDTLRASMRKAFEKIVHENTCDSWAEQLFTYDPHAVEVITGHFSGSRRSNHHVVHYKDHWDNILTFIIKLN